MIKTIQIITLFSLLVSVLLICFIYDTMIKLIIFFISVCIFSCYCFIIPERYIEDDNLEDMDNENDEIIPNNLVAIKVNNINDLHPHFSKECCICLEIVEPIDSFKLSNCNYHIYHESCIKSYSNFNFTRCPICNI